MCASSSESLSKLFLVGSETSNSFSSSTATMAEWEEKGREGGRRGREKGGKRAEEGRRRKEGGGKRWKEEGGREGGGGERREREETENRKE